MDDDASSAGPDASGASAWSWVGLGVGAAIFAGMVLAPVPAGLSAAGWHVAATGLLMAVWWMTEALPLAATSLVPLVAFPLLGARTFEQAARPYAHPLIFLFLGGFLIALAMERWGLHRRVALGVIRAVGTSPRRLVGGFMLAAGALSMWISNTATAMMMLPIGRSVVGLGQGEGSEEVETVEGGFGLALMLGLAYACSLGGAGTLIGTPANALLPAYLDEAQGLSLSFAAWMQVGVPLALVGGVLVYLALTRLLVPLPSAEDAGAVAGGTEALDRMARDLGPVRYPERVVAVVFGVVAVLWVTRTLLEGLVQGLSDSLIAVAGALVLFAWPARQGDGRRVLDADVLPRLPWDVLLLFGGGLSLAAAVEATGLATWIGEALQAVGGWPPALVVGLVVLVIVALTELTSNTATAAAFLPVLGALAAGIGMHPLRLLVPATLAASCAFMLPVATPPNAIVYGSGLVRIGDMARVGAGLNLLFVLLLTALAFTLVPLAFDLGALPAGTP